MKAGNDISGNEVGTNGSVFYILSGLGADHQIFSQLKLPENSIHLQWLENEANETLRSYASRMAIRIEHENVVLVGLSFGGIMAQEIAKIRPVKKIILISTVKAKQEKPWYINWSGKLNLPSWLPAILINTAFPFTNWIFGTENAEIKALLSSYLKNASPGHIRWAMSRIANWDNKEGNDCPVFHIHSKKDRVLPFSNVQADAVIDGGHLALHTNAPAMQAALDRFL